MADMLVMCKDVPVIGCHPFFDHNNAFDIEYMNNPDADYPFGNYTLREAAKFAMKKIDFFFTEEIVREDFITERQYNSFMSRAKDLGIQIKPYKSHFSPQYVKRVVELNSYYNLYLDVQKTLELLPTSELPGNELVQLLFNLSPVQANQTFYKQGNGSEVED